MEVSAFKLPVQQLEQEITKEESKYKHAIEQRKNYYTLREIREKIRVLKNALLNAPGRHDNIERSG
jgi:hypothetical protein